MLIVSNLKLMLTAAAAGLATPLIMSGSLPETHREIAASGEQPALIALAPGSTKYRMAGDFTRGGKPAEAPLATIRIARPFDMMKHQVSGADYQRCVDDGACRATVAGRADRPAVQVSFRDADAYAGWLSRRTGDKYRLPTDEEWAYAAGSRWKDDGLPVDATDPSRQWLARYEREANQKKSDDGNSEPRPIGAFGANENGLLDVAGNVWEWTSTCFVRSELDADGNVTGKPTINCGVRVVEGQHRAYVTDFIRDARAGGCAAGVPPANLGFRLVRDGINRNWRNFLLSAVNVLKV